MKRILVPLDGSARAEKALPHALALASAFGSEVILLRVVERTDVRRAEWTDAVEWRLGRAEALRYLEGIRQAFEVRGIDVDLDIGVGRASAEILELARARDVELIVLTTHGKGGASRHALAGTARKVVEGAETSILLVPAQELDAEGREGGPAYRHVIVPLDGSMRGRWAVSIAAALARSEKAGLILAHVITEPQVVQSGGVARAHQLARAFVEACREPAAHYLAELASQIESPDLVVRSEVLEGKSVADALQRLGHRESPSLIVLPGLTSEQVTSEAYATVPSALIDRGHGTLLILREQAATERARRRRWLRSAVSDEPEALTAQ